MTAYFKNYRKAQYLRTVRPNIKRYDSEARTIIVDCDDKTKAELEALEWALKDSDYTMSFNYWTGEMVERVHRQIYIHYMQSSVYVEIAHAIRFAQRKPSAWLRARAFLCRLLRYMHSLRVAANALDSINGYQKALITVKDTHTGAILHYRTMSAEWALHTILGFKTRFVDIVPVDWEQIPIAHKCKYFEI